MTSLSDLIMYGPERKKLVHANLSNIKGITEKHAAIPIDSLVSLNNVISISYKDNVIYFVNGTPS